MTVLSNFPVVRTIRSDRNLPEINMSANGAQQERIGRHREEREAESGDIPSVYNWLRGMLQRFFSMLTAIVRRFKTKQAVEEGWVEEKDFNYDRMVVFHSAPLAYRETQNKTNAFPFHDFDNEKQRILDSVEEASDIGKQIDVTFEVATLDRLEFALASDAYPIMHFSCHGDPHFLYIESERDWGMMKTITAESLKKIVLAGRKNIQVVFVAACYSREIGEAFLEAGVRHVVCCPTDEKLRHTGAMVFARSFYRSLACGRTLKEAVVLAREKVAQSTEEVRDSENEAKKFLLLPIKPDSDPYHDEKIFYKRLKRRPLVQRKRSYVIERSLPPTPQALRQHGLEVYQILVDIRKNRIVQLPNSFRTDNSILARAVCNFVRERSHVFFIEDIFWIEPKRHSKDNISKWFERILELTKGETGFSECEDCIAKIVDSLHDKHALIFIHVKHLNESAPMKKLGTYIRCLSEQTRHLKFIIICPPGHDIDPRPVARLEKTETKDEKIVDAYFAFNCPSTKFDNLDMRPKHLFSLKQLADSIEEYQNSDVSMKNSSFIITDGRKEDLKEELKSAHVRLLVWCGEGMDLWGCRDSSFISPELVAIAKRKPKLVIICLKYGAEYAAKKLIDKGVGAVIWLRMDPFLKDAKWMFTEIFHPFCKLYLPGEMKLIDCFSVLQQKAIQGGCNDYGILQGRGFWAGPNPVNYSVPEGDRRSVKLVTPTSYTTPWFISREVRSLKMNAEDYPLMDDAKDYLRRRSYEKDHSYLFLTPIFDLTSRDKKSKKKACERVRAAALYVCNFIGGNDDGVFNGGIYLVSSDADKEKTQDALIGKTDSALVWVDFKRSESKPVFESAQDLYNWIETIGQTANIAVVLTSDERYFEHCSQLEKEIDYMVSKCDHILFGKCTSESDLTMSNLIGFVPILPLVTNGNEKSCILDHVPYFMFQEALGKTLFSEEDIDLDKEVKLYRDDDGSVQVRLCVSDFKFLTRLRDLILMGGAAVKLGKELPILLAGGDSIQFDRSAMAAIYESLILRLESLTEHQQEKLDECEIKRRVHIEAPAGAGKTFVALNSTIDFLDRTSESVLFVCRNSSLAIHFVKWLCYRFYKESKLNKTLERVYTISDDGIYDICSYAYNRRLGVLDVYPSEQKEHLQFGKIIVDDAHDIFGTHMEAFISGLQTKAKAIIDRHASVCELMILSDESQASVFGNGGIAYPEGLDFVRLTEVCRSSKRIVAGALAYQLGDNNKVSCAHDSDGLPLSPILFDCNSEDDLETYATEIINAIGEVLKDFPTLDLHDRLAIVVPNEEFLKGLCGGPNSLLGGLLEKNAEEFDQHLVPKTALEASRALNLDESKRRQSWIVVDTIDQLEGLERLIVFGVGLDESFDDTTTHNAVVRSRIYRAITRAHLAYYLINKRIHGGWFEFIESLEFEKRNFSLKEEVKQTISHSSSGIIKENSSRLLASMSAASNCEALQRSFNFDDVKQGTWAVTARSGKQDPRNPYFMPFKQTHDSCLAEAIKKNPAPLDEDNTPEKRKIAILSENSKTLDPLSNENEAAGTSTEIYLPDCGPVGRVSSFRDAVLLQPASPESHGELPIGPKYPSQTKVTPKFVVTQVKQENTEFLSDSSIKEEEEVESCEEGMGGMGGMGGTDSNDYYHQKNKGVLARTHRVRLRPDEAKRREDIIKRNEEQKTKQKASDDDMEKKEELKKQQQKVKLI